MSCPEKTSEANSREPEVDPREEADPWRAMRGAWSGSSAGELARDLDARF